MSPLEDKTKTPLQPDPRRTSQEEVIALMKSNPETDEPMQQGTQEDLEAWLKETSGR